MHDHLYLVVMAGGTGTRLWPSSRQSHPKQFINILGTGKSLLQETCKRFEGIISPKNQIIASNSIYEEILKDQLPHFTQDQFFLEPLKKNTAPCIAYAAYKIAKKDPDAIMIVAPSDHAIANESVFLEKIQAAVYAAEEGKLVTIGIRPDRPEIGYGYIQHLRSEDEVKRVKTFTEKPPLDLAKKFLESGDFVWNAGIFVWKAQTIIQAFEHYEPEMAEIFHEGNDFYYTDREAGFVQRAYSQCKGISIDYAIMEKAENVYCVLGDFGWSDLGSWQAIYEFREKDDQGNVLEGELIEQDNSGNIIEIKEGKTAIIEGLENFLVMDMDDVLVIVPKDDSARFQRIVKTLKKEGRKDLL